MGCQSLSLPLSPLLSLHLCLLTISSPHPQLESLITGYDLWPIRQVLISLFYSTVTMSISTHPWKGCQSIAQISHALNSLVPTYTLGWREVLGEWRVWAKNTTTLYSACAGLLDLKSRLLFHTTSIHPFPATGGDYKSRQYPWIGYWFTGLSLKRSIHGRILLLFKKIFIPPTPWKGFWF